MLPSLLAGECTIRLIPGANLRDLQFDLSVFEYHGDGSRLPVVQILQVVRHFIIPTFSDNRSEGVFLRCSCIFIQSDFQSQNGFAPIFTGTPQ